MLCVALGPHQKSGMILVNIAHRLDSFYKWPKFSSLEITIFDFKMMVKSCLEFYFKIHQAPSELLLPSAKISAQNGRIGLAA